jgi:general secretion pathway protein D
VHFGNDPADIPDTDELITQVIPIQNVNAPKLRDDLKPIIGLDADISANEGSNTIIITDTSSAVRRVLQIISQIDQHESSITQLRVVQLKHANASAVAKVIDSLFKNSTPQIAQQGPQRPPQPGQPGGDAGGGGPERHGATVVTASDDRTNTLLVTASSATLKLIDDIIARLDSDNTSPVAPVAVRYRVLKFAAADATAKLINSMFKQAQDTNNPYYYIYGNGRAGSDQGAKEAPLVAVSDDRTNTVIVTGPPERMKSIDELMDKLDTSPTVSQDLRVIHLKYADAEDVAKLVQDMFAPKKDQSQLSSNYVIYEGTPPSDQKIRDLVIKVSSDSRTNSVLVSAPKEMLDTIEKIVHQLDSDPATEDTMFIYHLRNSQSDHLAYTLNVLFGNVGGNQNNQNNQNNQQNQQPGQNNPNQQNPFGNQNQGQNNSDNSNNNSNNGSTSTNRNSRNGQTAGRGQVAQATNELTGKVLVVSEPDTNALLVTTASKYATQVRKIIDDLDRPVPQVLIKALIAEVSRDDSRDLGVDFSILNLRANGKGDSIGQTFGLPTNGLIAEILETNVTATLHALAVNGKLDVLSRPYILASDNQLATINVGQSVPFITESRLDPVNNNEINVINYRDIGVILNVTPHINPDGLVILDVTPEVSSFTQSTLQLSQGVTSPIFQKRSANTRVAIMDGQTIVIGGLMQDQNTTTRSKIPLLGDLPLIGALFRRDQVDRTKTELLVFLTPHVAPQPDALQGMSRDELKGTVLTPQAVAPGVYQQHLDGLDRGKAPATQPSTQPVSPVKSIDLSDQGDKVE